jgi:hypothetical protein
MSSGLSCVKRLSHGLFLIVTLGLALTGGAQIQPGSTVTISVSSGPGNKGDWIGLFRVGSAEDGFNTLAWCFLSGTQAYPSEAMSMAKIPFVLPKNLSPGEYEFRFYASDNYFRRLATGNTFTVGSGGNGTPKITATPMQIQAGSSVSISVSGSSGINDWVGLFRVGAPSDNTNLLAWSYLNGTQHSPPAGTAAGTFTFVMPKDMSNLSAGEYEFRLFANDDFKAPLANTQMLTLGAGAKLGSAP